MRIAFFADITTANGHYRALSPMTALARRGHLVVEVRPPVDRARLRQFDVLFVHRYADPHTLAFARTAHDEGLGVMWDNDDDFSSISKSLPAYREYGGLRWERRRVAMQRIFEIAMVVTSPNPTLSQIHADLGARVVDVIPNRVSESELIRPQRRDGTVVIGWVAESEHRLDAQAMNLDAIIERVLLRAPNLRFELLGIKPGRPSERYVHVPPVHITRLISRVAGFDIGIAPLADLRMNHSRSDVKVREYAAASVPWLASDRGPYVGLGKKEGGMLVADGSWEEALYGLATDEKARRKLSKAARKWAESETIERSADEWEKVLVQAVELRQAM